MKYNVSNSSIITFLFLLLVIGTSSCKKFIAVDVPATKVSELSVFSSDATAAATLTGVYGRMSGVSAYNTGFITFTKLAGLYADELILYKDVTSPGLVGYYKNDLNLLIAPGSELWLDLYPYISNVNEVIEGLEKASALTPSVKAQLTGEAYFIRALLYFYLVNTYGGVPLITGTSYEKNSLAPKSSIDSVYTQIVGDLMLAKQHLSVDYLDGTLKKVTKERVRPTKAAASALLARVYLYRQQWSQAYDESKVVMTSTQFSLSPLGNVFLKNSSEAIWQLQPVLSGFNTQDAVLYVLPDSGPNQVPNTVYLSDSVVKAFELGDQRRSNWIGSVTVASTKYYYPYKYKISITNSAVTSPAAMTEYLMMLRLSEQLLINAEAAVYLGKYEEAISSLNKIRKRARAEPDAVITDPLPDIVQSTNRDSLLKIIYHERQTELFAEWGHRWLDLKRTGRADAVMSTVTPAKGGTWQSYKQLFPIPFLEITKNNNLSQNPGYN